MPRTGATDETLQDIFSTVEDVHIPQYGSFSPKSITVRNVYVCAKETCPQILTIEVLIKIKKEGYNVDNRRVEK